MAIGPLCGSIGGECRSRRIPHLRRRMPHHDAPRHRHPAHHLHPSPPRWAERQRLVVTSVARCRAWRPLVVRDVRQAAGGRRFGVARTMPCVVSRRDQHVMFGLAVLVGGVGGAAVADGIQLGCAAGGAGAVAVPAVAGRGVTSARKGSCGWLRGGAPRGRVSVSSVRPLRRAPRVLARGGRLIAVALAERATACVAACALGRSTAWRTPAWPSSDTQGTRMPRFRAVVAAVALLALASASTAVAHQGNANYRSLISAVTPPVPGVKLQVLNFDDRLALLNTSGKTIVIQGYNSEPYARGAGRRHRAGQPALAGLLPQQRPHGRRQGARVGQPGRPAAVEVRRQDGAL